MTHVFLTGERGVGKSTALKKTLSLLSTPAGGLATRFDGPRDAPARTLYLRAYGDPAQGCPAARMAGCRGPADRLAFDAVGAALLRRASTLYPLIVMDELGALERQAQAFQRQVMMCLEGDKPVLGVARWGDIPWLAQVKDHPRVHLIHVTPHNRDQVPAQAAALLAPHLRPLPPTPWRYQSQVRYDIDQVALYDEERRPLGLYDRRGDSAGYRLHVGLWVRDGQGRYLLVRRHPQVRVNPGLYEGPGGHVLAGETPRQAAARELMEETGIEVRQDELKLVGTRRDDRYFCDTFLAEKTVPLENLVLQPDESVAALWAGPDQIRQMAASGQAVDRPLP